MFQKAMCFPGLMRPVMIIALLGLLSGCGSGGLTDPPSADSTGGGGGAAAATAPAGVSLLVSNAQLKSDMIGSPTVTLTAIVKDSGNRALKDQEVSFSSDSGVLGSISGKTDDNGIATAKLGTGGDPTYRTINVSATAGSTTGRNSVAVTGTQISIDPATFSLPYKDATGKQIIVSLKDSEGKAISGKTVTLTAASKSKFGGVPPYVTDGSGQVKVTLTNGAGLDAGDAVGDTITASAIGVSAQAALTINTAELAINAPLADAKVPINTAQPFTVSYKKNNVLTNGQTIYFTSTRGTLSGGNLTATSSTTGGAPDFLAGVARISLTSANSGPAVLTAYTSDAGVDVTQQRSIVFLAGAPDSMTLSAYPAVVNANAPGQTSEQSMIKAVVRDTSGNLVMDQDVDFSIIQDASAGELARDSNKTDLYGTATTNYIAGRVAGGLNNVKIRATVRSKPTVTATTTLTVGGQALFISLATGREIQKIATNKYQKDYVALVTDAGGRPVANAVVTATVTPQYYLKGYHYICGEVWCQMKTLVASKSTTPSVPACANEDGYTQNPLYDFNGLLDPGEDQNANSRLDPGNVVSVTAATTDSSGNSTISLTYAQDYAHWVSVRLEVRANLAGSTASAFQTFELPGLAADYNDVKVTPPGQPSPFGTNTSCYPDFTVLALSATKISMNWEPSAYADSYRIYKDPNNGVQALLINNGKTTNYDDENGKNGSTVTAGTTYCYEIRQVIGGVESSLSPQGANRVCASSQPTAPTIVTANPATDTAAISPTQIRVVWSDAGAAAYRIYRNGLPIQDSVTRTIVNANLNANTTYCYAVSSLSANGGESAKSATVCKTTQDTSPAATALTGATGGVLAAGPPATYKVDLTWGASAGAALYRVYRDGVLVLSSTGAAATDTKDVKGQTGYCYTVSAVNQEGNESAQSAPRCTATP